MNYPIEVIVVSDTGSVSLTYRDYDVHGRFSGGISTYLIKHDVARWIACQNPAQVCKAEVNRTRRLL